MRINVNALRGYSVIDNNNLSLILQIQGEDERIDLFGLPTPELPTMLSHIIRWVAAQNEHIDIEVANKRLEEIRLETEKLPAIDKKEAERRKQLKSAQFGAKGAWLFLDVTLSKKIEKNYLFDLPAAQFLAVAIEEHLGLMVTAEV